MTVRRLSLVGATLGALALAACGAGATPTPVPATPAPAATPAAGGGGAAIEAKSTGTFGNILVAGQGTKDNLGADRSGFTLYYFTKDTKDSGASACTAKCYANWPSLVVPTGTTPTAGAGVTGTIGTITRSDDGMSQVTLNGMPLYFFVKDKAAGDTFGYYPFWGVVNADGTLVVPPSPPPATPGAASPAAAGPAIEAKAVGTFPNIVIAGQGAVDNLGADKSGFTLYYFTKDTKDSGASVCTDKCYANWPALVVPDGTTPTAGTGVTGTLGTIKRADDGKTQVTLNGLPLYFFVKDKAAGDSFGYYPFWGVVNADGTLVVPPSPPPATPAAASPSP